MSDKMGILGRTTDATVGTKTVYTCPASKAAKVRLEFYGLNAGVGNATLTINVASIPVMASGNVAINNYIYSIGDAVGLLSSGGVAAAPDGTTVAKTVQPAKPIYYLSAGDVITATVGTNAFANLQVRVVGIETDV